MASDITFPTKTIARLLDLTVARVGQLAKEGVIPKAENGRYPPEAIKAYIQYLRERAFGKGMAPSDQHQERTRLLKGQADKVELEVAEMEGILIPADDVLEEWGAMTMAFRARMLALIPRLSSFAISATSLREIEDYTRAEVYAALDELSEYGKTDKQISEADSRASTGANTLDS